MDMESDLTHVLASFPGRLDHAGSILASVVDGPARADEVNASWPGAVVPEELVNIWLTARQATLLHETEYGQSGLSLLSPSASAEATSYYRTSFPEEFRSTDIVIGTFEGDSDVLVYSAEEPDKERLLIAPEIPFREEWVVAGATLSEFLQKYLEAFGDRFWDPANQ